MLGAGSVSELVLLDGSTAARVSCAAGLVPAPGQYTLAHADGSQAPLTTALFASRTDPDGFITAAPVPSTWAPGTRLHLRGPLGQGFALPATARRIALVAFGCSARTLFSLVDPALRQRASVALVSEAAPEDLPLEVEAHPLSALRDTCEWADYVAFDVTRELLPGLKENFQAHRTTLKAEAQALVRAPMPCGALAACGVCAVQVGGKGLLACEDGPVFDFRQLIGWSSRA